MTTRDEIFTDGTCNDQTGVGGRAAIKLRWTSGRHENTNSQEMELRAIVEAVKMAEGPTTVVSDHEGIIGVARRGMTPRMCNSLWQELYAAAAGKDIEYAWRRRDQSLGSRLANQLARAVARGRS